MNLSYIETHVNKNSKHFKQQTTISKLLQQDFLSEIKISPEISAEITSNLFPENIELISQIE